MKNLFVYGSLMFDEVWDNLIRRKHQKRSATAYGYGRFTVTGETYPGLTRRLHSEVQGVLITGLNKDELRLLDRFEGHYYTRKRIAVVTDGSSKVSCETYIFKKRYRRLLSSTEWSQEAFRQKHLLSVFNKLQAGGKIP